MVKKINLESIEELFLYVDKENLSINFLNNYLRAKKVELVTGDQSLVLGVIDYDELSKLYSCQIYVISNENISTKSLATEGIKDLEEAYSLLDSKINYEIVTQKINSLVNGVDFLPIDFKSANPPFPVPLIGLIELKMATVYDTNIMTAKYLDGASVYNWKTSEDTFGKITHSGSADLPDFNIDNFIKSQSYREVRQAIAEHILKESTPSISFTKN